MIARRVAAILVAGILAGGAAAPASGWNDAGHLLVALVAYDRLSEPVRVAVHELLQRHPRYASDLVARMPSGVRSASAAERNRWLFAAASTWPDFVRAFDGVMPETRRAPLVDRYHHPQWHYVNQPLFLDAEEQLTPVATNDSFVLHEKLRPERMNVVQALLHLRAQLESPETSSAGRAVALCWLLHLTADLHQPLHTVSLYTRAAFPDGDRGGNLIAIGTRENLHSVWDGAAGRDRRWGAVNKTYLAMAAIPVPGEPIGDFAARAREGRDLADRVVYVPSIRETVRHATSPPGIAVAVELPQGYLARMRETALRQVALAGLRLARLLEEAFGAR